MVSGPVSSRITTGESSSTTASAKISTSSHRHGRSGTRWCPDEHPPRNPPSQPTRQCPCQTSFPRASLERSKTTAGWPGRHRDGEALRERVQGGVVGHAFQFGIRIGQVCRPKTGSTPSQDRWCRTGHLPPRGTPARTPLPPRRPPFARIRQPTTLKMGAERFSKDVEPIHLRIRVNAEISIATHVRIRGQPGQPNGGVRVIGHRFIKKCNQ